MRWAAAPASRARTSARSWALQSALSSAVERSQLARAALGGAAQEAKQALLRGVGAHAADDSRVRFTPAVASTIRRRSVDCQVAEVDRRAIVLALDEQGPGRPHEIRRQRKPQLPGDRRLRRRRVRREGPRLNLGAARVVAEDGERPSIAQAGRGRRRGARAGPEARPRSARSWQATCPGRARCGSEPLGTDPERDVVGRRRAATAGGRGARA